MIIDMKLKNILSGLAVVAVAFLTGCSNEIPSADSSCIDNLPDPDSLMVKKDYVSDMKHPCMLHSQSDIDFVKSHLTQSPWKEGYAYLEQSSLAQASVTDETSALLDGYLKRMDAKNWSGKYADYANYTAAMHDAAKAYQLGLRYQLSGDKQYAETAVKILNAWGEKCKGYLTMGGYTDSIPDPNIYLLAIQGYQFANAAELVRGYNNWEQSEGFAKFKGFMKNTYYKLARTFLTNHNGGQGSQYCWLNWDLANMTSMLACGILFDDNYMINYAISYFKNEDGLFSENGNILNAVPYTHKDPDSDEILGQCEESGRDQGHATLCVSLMGVFCQMAYNIGEDLFAYADGRALAMAEYVAKYNLRKDEFYKTTGTLPDTGFQYSREGFPYTAYTNPSWSCPSLSSIETSNGAKAEASRGQLRPCWELFYGYAKAHNKSAIYCGKWVEQMRTLNDFKCDGGSGTYDKNSGGYDQLGFGTLMFAR